jgi:DNA invertase Pin-like site-specific DNA recombinase
VLALAAKRMTRQAIANELGISLASVYRILKENR